jgi:hypothetical protein
MFEKAMGIEITESFTKIQAKLREGMYQAHIDIQDFFESNSRIKIFCQQNNLLTEAYR